MFTFFMESKMSWGLLAVKENQSLMCLGMLDSTEQKRILESITDQPLLNDLLEYHLISEENITASKNILEAGANPDFVCRGIGNYHYQLTTCSPSFLNQNFLVYEPLIIQSYKRCMNKNNWKGFNEQVNLLFDHDVNFNISDKYGIPFYKLLLKGIDKSNNSQNQRACDSQFKNHILVNLLSDMIENNLDISEDCYNQNKEIFSLVAKELVGRKAEKKIKNDSNYTSFQNVIYSIP